MKKKNLLLTLALSVTISVFSPFISVVSAAEAEPKIKGQATLVMDYETGEVIYEVNGDKKMYPASTTKVLAALVLADHAKKDDPLKYTEFAKKQPSSSINTDIVPIKVGDTLSADTAMKALLMHSANDAAYLIAEDVGGNKEGFADLMNKKAKELNANNTNFVTPNGLHDANHYSTVYDLSLITKAGFQNEWVREAMSLKKADIKVSNKTISLDNTNKNLGKNGNVAGKTGFTTEAGRCLVSVYERNNRKLIGVVLKSTKDNNDTQVFKDMEAVVDYSYKQKKVPYAKSSDKMETTSVEYKPFKFFGPTKTIDVPFVLNEDIEYYKNSMNDSDAKLTISLDNVNAWELANKSKSATAKFQTRNYSKDYNLTANITTSDILKANIVLYSICIFVIIAVIVTIYIIVRRSKKKKAMAKRRKKRRSMR